MKHNFFRLIFIFLGIISSFNGLVMFFITAIELKTIFLKLAVVGIVFGMLFWAESLHLFKTANIKKINNSRAEDIMQILNYVLENHQK